MEIEIANIALFIGNYGSGKTEVAVNYATNRKAAGFRVRIADLDIVNPYFRSREVKKILEELGIEVVVPEDRLLDADLPVVVPGVKGMIESPDGVNILDVGGDDVGATVLGSLHQALVNAKYDMLQVVNAKRPFTETVEDTIKITREIEAASRLKVTGVVGNSHLMDETDAAVVREGYVYAKAVAQALGVPVKFITAEERLLGEFAEGEFDCPVLPIMRQMLPPWRRREKLGSQNFRLS